MRVCAFLALLHLVANVAHAARMDPPPLVESLRAGYGVVAVTLVDHKPTGEVGLHSVHLRVEKLVAAPAVGAELPVKAAQVINIEMSIGYGGDLEPLPNIEQGPKAGMKLLVALRVNPTTGDLEGLQYSGAVRQVKEFDPATLQTIARIRDLAAAQPPADSAMARRILGEDTVPDELRWNAHTVLRKAVDPAERQANLKFLHDQWRAISIEQPYDRLSLLDQSLCELDPAFKASDARVDGWFGVIFAPFAPADDPRSGTASNSHLIPSRLDDLAKVRPDQVAQRVTREMQAEHWPLYFRWRLAGALQGLYQRADVEHPEWNAELQRFYATAFHEAGPWELRLLPSSMTHGLEEPKYDRKRRFVADQATWDAMAAAQRRMEALVRREPQHPDAVSAVRTLREALKQRPR